MIVIDSPHNAAETAVKFFVTFFAGVSLGFQVGQLYWQTKNKL